MSGVVTRRSVLAGLMSGVAGAVVAQPVSSLRPVARAGVAVPEAAVIPKIAPRARPTLAQIVAAANLDGTVGCIVSDAETGEVLEQLDAEVGLPPASVTKSVTALYTLDALGGAHRFETRILATGTVLEGILSGDLILAGGGDPTLTADDLADLADAVKAAGIDRVDGRLLCWRGALPYAEEIEPSQLDHLGYNPAVSGLNLNFNRVHFEWKRVGGVWETSMDARTENRVPPVSMAQIRLVERGSPVFDTDGPDRWSVARSALGTGGSRWLPVRQPALYAGDVFATLARGVDLDLPAPEVVDDLPAGREIARHESATLRQILAGMLRFSTNLTAEVCGLAATRTKYGVGLGIEASAAQMTRWAAQTHGIECDFKDHSGLSDETTVSARAMNALLLAVGADGPLRPILREIAILDAGESGSDAYPVEVKAKTGTLNFVSALSGYVQTANGSDLVFTIFAADLERRAAGKRAGDEVPAGSVAWNGRAKQLQQTLLQRWGLIYRSGSRDADVPVDPTVTDPSVRPLGGVSLDGLAGD